MKSQASPSISSGIDALSHIESEIISCMLCPLANTRKNAVPGEGPIDAQIMLIGEGPGHHENEQGLPFVGASGKLLTELLASIGLKRSDVYITNVIKCRAPGNRDPQPNEIEACGQYLDRQIKLINPSVIVTLGRFSMARWFPGKRISDIHGKPKTAGTRIVVPMFHPAAALHQPKYRPLLVEDFKKLPELVSQSKLRGAGSGSSSMPSSGQLNLF